MFPNKIGLNILKGFPSNAETTRPEVAPIDAFVGRFVETITLPLRPFASKAEIEPVVDQRDVDHAFEAALVIVAEFAGRHGLELVGGFGGNQIDDASRRIAAIECSLGSAKHFDLRDVVEFLFEEVISNERHVV